MAAPAEILRVAQGARAFRGTLGLFRTERLRKEFERHPLRT